MANAQKGILAPYCPFNLIFRRFAAMARPLLLSALLLAAVWARVGASPAPALQLNALTVVHG